MRKTSRPSTCRRLLALPARERQLLLEAGWTLLVAAVRLRFAPRRTVARALAGSPPPRSGAHGVAGTSLAVARAVSRAAAHHLWPMTCLPRSIALQGMLARRGIPAALRIGVRKEPAGSGGSTTIAAHAWVEVAGQALSEPEAIEERFRPLLPPAAGPRDGAG